MRKIICLLGIIVCVFSCAKQEKGELDAELLEMLNSTDFVNIEFGGKYMGYEVRAQIYPDEDHSAVGMGRFYFTNSSGTVEIDTPYYWDWEEEIRIRPCAVPGGEARYWVPFRDKAVQGGNPEIEMVMPFCCKDVDFDGIREICFTTIGYNRVYYSVFKLMSDTLAVRMSEMPFSEIIYGLGDTKTVFDYEEKTIIVYEQIGYQAPTEKVYVRRKLVMDPLKPMRLIKE